MKKMFSLFVNNYFVCRLAPFLGVALAFSLCQIFYLLGMYPSFWDLPLNSLFLMLGAIFLEAGMLFVYVILLLFFCLLFIPFKKAKKQPDRRIITIFFFGFCFVNCFNVFIDVSFFRYSQPMSSQTILTQLQSFPFIWLISSLFVMCLLGALLSWVVTKLWKPYLITRLPLPSLARRFFVFSILFFLSAVMWTVYSPKEKYFLPTTTDVIIPEEAYSVFQD